MHLAVACTGVAGRVQLSLTDLLPSTHPPSLTTLARKTHVSSWDDSLRNRENPLSVSWTHVESKKEKQLGVG